MNYIIDGYNVIGKLKAISLSDPEKEEKLQKLIDRLAPGKKDSFHLIFDGHNHYHPHGSRTTIGRFKISFTALGESADDYLKHLIETTKSKTNICIVTSDSEILIEAARKRILTQRSELFLSNLFKESPSQKPGAKLSEDEIQYWTKKFSN